MSAVMEVREPSVTCLSALRPPLVQHFEQMATAPGGVARLRELILALAVQGKLMRQDPEEESAERTLERSRAEMRERMLKGVTKKEKPSADIVDDEVPFSLPCGWQWCRLTDTGEYVNGLAFKASDFLPSGLPVIRIQNLSGRSSEFNRVNGDFPASVLVSAGDILVSWSATLDAFIWRGENGVLNQHIFRVEPSPAVDKGFLYWLLKWAIRDLAASDHAHGLVMSHINRGPFLSKLIGLPPLAEQFRIVTRVEELMRLCDALEAKGQLEAAQHAQLVQTLLAALTASTSPEELADNWQRVATHFDLLLDRPEAIDALEQTIQQLAVRGLLTRTLPKSQHTSVGSWENSPDLLPPTWSFVRLGEILLDLRYGTAVKCGYDTYGHPVLRIPNLRNGAIDATDLKFGALTEDDVSKLALARGDVLIVRSNGSASLVGSMAVVGVESEGFAFAGYLVRARLNPELLTPEYLNLVAKTAVFREQIEGPIRTTSGVKNINSSEISRLSFALPPLDQQRLIVARVESLRRLCTDLRQRLVACQTTQTHLAEALIKEVV